MILLCCILILAFCFAAFVGFSLVNFLIGLILAVVLLGFLPQIPRPRGFDVPPIRSGKKLLLFVGNLLYFVFDFILDLTLSNLEIAYEVWTPRNRYTPRLIFVPVSDLTDLELTLLSSRITLTPGTLSADVTKARDFLIVHVMYQKAETDEAIAENLRKPIDLLRRNL